MKKCSICKNDAVTSTSAETLSKIIQLPLELCEDCSKNADILLNNSVSKSQKNVAKNYFCLRLDNIENREIQAIFKSFLQDEITIEQPDPYSINLPPDDTPSGDDIIYFGSRSSSSKSVWVSGLKILAWVLFMTIIIVGTVLGCSVGSYEGAGIGFLIILCSVVIAFLSTAGMMIYLDMVSDIAEIRSLLAKKH